MNHSMPMRILFKIIVVCTQHKSVFSKRGTINFLHAG